MTKPSFPLLENLFIAFVKSLFCITEIDDPILTLVKLWIVRNNFIKVSSFRICLSTTPLKKMMFLRSRSEPSLSFLSLKSLCDYYLMDILEVRVSVCSTTRAVLPTMPLYPKLISSLLNRLYVSANLLSTIVLRHCFSESSTSLSETPVTFKGGLKSLNNLIVL